MCDLGCNSGDLSMQLFQRIAAAGAHKNKDPTCRCGC